MIMESKYEPFMSELESLIYKNSEHKLTLKLKPLDKRIYEEEIAYIENGVRDKYNSIIEQIISNHTPFEMRELLDETLEALEPTFCQDIKNAIAKEQKRVDEIFDNYK